MGVKFKTSPLSPQKKMELLDLKAKIIFFYKTLIFRNKDSIDMLFLGFIFVLEIQTQFL